MGLYYTYLLYIDKKYTHLYGEKQIIIDNEPFYLYHVTYGVGYPLKCNDVLSPSATNELFDHKYKLIEMGVKRVYMCSAGGHIDEPVSYETGTVIVFPEK
jgi:hypothetical protein